MGLMAKSLRGLPRLLAPKKVQVDMTPRITAWHGSGAKFDAFQPGFAGRGEGAQAQGYGHYVTESQHSARKYASPLKTFSPWGFLYKLEVSADPARMVHRDLPMARQSETVQRAIRALDPDLPPDATGAQALSRLTGRYGDKGASKRLQEAGLDGIQFIDKSSQHGSPGYVVFDEGNLRIVKRERVINPIPFVTTYPMTAGAVAGGVAVARKRNESDPDTWELRGTAP